MRVSEATAAWIGRLVKGAVSLGLFLFFAYRAWYVQRPRIPEWLRLALVISGSLLILTVAEMLD